MYKSLSIQCRSLNTCSTGHGLTQPTLTPFETLLSRRAQSGRYNFLFRETGVVHRITYSFNYFFLLVLFTQFIVDKIKKIVLYQVKQLNHILSKQHSHCTPSLTPPVHDSLPYWTASVRYQLLTVSPFKSLPSYFPPTVPNIS